MNPFFLFGGVLYCRACQFIVDVKWVDGRPRLYCKYRGCF